jgi:hypothetical protein
MWIETAPLGVNHPAKCQTPAPMRTPLRRKSRPQSEFDGKRSMIERLHPFDAQGKRIQRKTASSQLL